MRRLRSTSAPGLAAAGVLLLCATLMNWSPRVVYNPSTSAPIGWYIIRPANTLRRHDIVLARLPETAGTLAEDRHYLPLGIPLLKEVGAVDGQFVCVLDGIVSIDGVAAAHVRRRDGAGRSLTAWSECRVIAKGELFLLGRSSDASFDSRYFGPIRRDAVLGRATPLWTW